MDIVCEIMRIDAPVAESAGRWKLGDIVNVRDGSWIAPGETDTLLTRIGGVCNVPRKCYLVITGIPAQVTLDKIKSVLERYHYADDDEVTNPEPVSRRKWRADVNNLPAAWIAALTSPPYYYETTWADAKSNAAVRNKINNNAISDSDFA